MAESIRIQHSTKRSGMATVSVYTKPINGLRRLCPTCNIIHPVKTVHLWLDDVGTCLVSKGVLQDLQQAGMPDLVVVGSIVNPPPLDLRLSRPENDHQNTKIRFWKEPTIV